MIDTPTDLSPSDELESESTPSTETETSSEVTDEGETRQPGKKSAEARIHELLSENKELEGRLKRVEEKLVSPTPLSTSTQPTVTPQVQRAIDYLKELGFVKKEDLEEREKATENKMVLISEHQRLENRYSGSDGRPKYERSEIETYMRKHAIYDPDAAYSLLHKSELLDWEIKKYEADKKKKPFVIRPSSSGNSREDNIITSEKISEKLKTPEGREWYEKNRKKILTLMAEGKL